MPSSREVKSKGTEVKVDWAMTDQCVVVWLTNSGVLGGPEGGVVLIYVIPRFSDPKSVIWLNNQD